ncbi:DNA-3-methyladenine glycosylase I [Marinimicrococcus flavescens]|uniref:DNA-3-methyladenine glycosylase I n=1 Tax=Marinimicrococcus flavescens TaxID=3031815 RepID=A0AAP3V0D1_9PROT|nr:DNA-3-methyladenine glycosylase I [Marinimicrococcus flavescens]
MRAATGFAEIEAAAIARHGREGVESRLARPRSEAELTAMPDDRLLSLMSLRIFRAGLRHSVVDARWPAFEEAFGQFDIERCAGLWDERLEELLGDRRLIRHLPKMRAVRGNARAILELRAEGIGFGAWLAGWPSGDAVGLWAELARRFTQLGGNSAPSFLRMAGKDTFLPTEHVARALQHWGATTGALGARAERLKAQEAFNGWHEETGRPLCQLSQILAMSVG